MNGKTESPPTGASRGLAGLRRLLCLCAFFAAAPAPAWADDPLPRNIFGTPGLIDTPSARMAPDGELSIGASFFTNNQHYTASFQALPWLETSFRYSGLQHYYGGFDSYYDRSFALKARLWNETDTLPAVAIGVNDTVGTGVYAGEYLVASKRFGTLDANLGLGWGRLGSTALFRNPLTLISHSFESRGEISGAGNPFLGQLFHGPSAALFGGVAWQTPVTGLSLLAEYSSDRYEAESRTGNFVPRNQFNLGVLYRPWDALQLGLDWFHGSGIVGSVNLIMDPVHQQYPVKLNPPPPPRALRTPQQQQVALQTFISGHEITAPPRLSTASLRGARNGFVDNLLQTSPDLEDVRVRGRVLMLTVTDETPQRCRTFAGLAQGAGNIDMVMLIGRGRNAGANISCRVQKPPQLIDASFTEETAPDPDSGAPSITNPIQSRAAILAEARKQHIHIDTLALHPGEAIVYYTNTYYFTEFDAIGRLTRILMADAPPSVEKFRLIAVDGGMPQREFDVLRAPLERMMAQQGSPMEIYGTAITSQPAAMDNPVLSAATPAIYPRFSWSVFPQLHQALFDPQRPLGLQLLAGGGAALEILPGLSLQGEAELSLLDNFNTDRPSDSQLPHVRTDFLRYFTQGKNGIGDLEADYRFRLSPTVFGIARAGYLESMFAGAGGEILWRPEGQRWALGVDGYQVWQRDFDRLFGLQSYRVATGHVSLYYASPWYDINFRLSAGRYLAGDTGLTVQLTRRFDTGVEIGLFFTKTNVSADRFGEGSFDKGIILRFPLNWISPIESQRQFNVDLRPVQRDGGQRLAGDALLYDATRNVSDEEMFRHLDTDIFQ
jgi:hypothetical protein